MTWFSGGLGSPGVKAGIDDLKRFFPTYSIP